MPKNVQRPYFVFSFWQYIINVLCRYVLLLIVWIVGCDVCNILTVSYTSYVVLDTLAMLAAISAMYYLRLIEQIYFWTNKLHAHKVKSVGSYSFTLAKTSET